MRCPNCSAEINDNAKECDFCGHVIAPASVSSAPPPGPAPASESNPYAGVASTPPPVRSGSRAAVNAGDIPNHMVLSVIAAVLSICVCCIPLGGLAVYFSSQVNTKFNEADFDGARNFSNYAKITAWIFIGLFVISLLYNIFFFDMEAFNQAMQAAQQGG